MLKVALTGGIGSGKSQASEIFEDLGALVVDSDQLSRDVIERGTPGFDEVVSEFGDEILSNGEIDRTRLAEAIFGNPDKRKLLEEIIHPRVRAAFEDYIKSAPNGSVVIYQIPLLVETDGAKFFDVIISITAPVEIRTNRLRARGMKDYEIEQRISAQVSDSEREKISDFIIDNSGTKEDLARQIEAIYEKLKSSASNN